MLIYENQQLAKDRKHINDLMNNAAEQAQTRAEANRRSFSQLYRSMDSNLDASSSIITRQQQSERDVLRSMYPLAPSSFYYMMLIPMDSPALRPYMQRLLQSKFVANAQQHQSVFRLTAVNMPDLLPDPSKYPEEKEAAQILCTSRIIMTVRSGSEPADISGSSDGQWLAEAALPGTKIAFDADPLPDLYKESSIDLWLKFGSGVGSGIIEQRVSTHSIRLMGAGTNLYSLYDLLSKWLVISPLLPDSLDAKTTDLYTFNYRNGVGDRSLSQPHVFKRTDLKRAESGPSGHLASHYHTALTNTNLHLLPLPGGAHP